MLFYDLRLPMRVPPSYAFFCLFLVALLVQRPLCAQVSAPTEPTALTAGATALPAASQKITAAVYPFRIAAEQQYQPTQTMPRPVAIANYTTLLFEVLRTSNWFVPVESANMGTLLNSRQAQPLSTSEAGNSDAPTAQQPTLILESGLFSNDAMPVSAETVSSSGPTTAPGPWRQDRATVFIRAISVQTGQLLKTVYWTKTILSQPTGTNTYRYLLANQPNAPLTGTTSVSPDRMAIVEAMKQAVDGLIIEGVRDGLWATSAMPIAQTRSMIATYEARRLAQSGVEEAEAQPKGNRQRRSPSFIDVSLYGGLSRYTGDYVNPLPKGAYGLSIDAYAIPYLGVQLNAATGTLASRAIFSTNVTSLEANLLVRPLPFWRFTPLVVGGVGMLNRTGSSPLTFEGRSYLQYQAGLGLQYALSTTVGFRAMVMYNLPQTDLLDGKQAGAHNDFYVRSTLGLVLHFGQYTRRSDK